MAMNLVCSYLAHPVDVARAASHYEKHAAGTYVVRGNWQWARQSAAGILTSRQTSQCRACRDLRSSDDAVVPQTGGECVRAEDRAFDRLMKTDGVHTRMQTSSNI